jgi:hypothetical protein
MISRRSIQLVNIEDANGTRSSLQSSLMISAKPTGSRAFEAFKSVAILPYNLIEFIRKLHTVATIPGEV